jgi:hypothetical protein
MNLRSAARAAALLSASLSALGAVQPSCGRTIVYVEPSVCASLNELACRERIDCKAVYGGGSADGGAAYVRCAVVGASCSGSICDACPEGTKPILDSAGCDTCQCQGENCPAPACGACPDGTKPVLDPKGCDTCRCTPSTCGPVCTIECPNGNVLDADGCPTCQCKPTACPAPKPCPLCVTGYVTDANGCQTCECTPGIACDSEVDCRPDLSCQPDPTDPCNDPAALCVRPGRRFCLPSPTCTSHAECPAGQYCTVNCEPGKPCITMLGQCRSVCRADADCSSGQICQPDPTDPCNSDPTLQCFAPGRRTCQPAPTSCTSHAECPAGEYCTVSCEPGKPCDGMLGRCQPVCRADADCSSGQTCQPDPTDPCNSDPTIQCFAPGRRTCQPAPTSCMSHAECPSGQYCTVNCEPGNPCDGMLGHCQPVCQADADCSNGQTCQPDPTDPCNSDPNVQCIAPGRLTCQPAPTACGGPPSYRGGYQGFRSTLQEDLRRGWCKVAQTCGGMSFVDCHSEVDGPAYYVDSATGCVLEVCGGACMGRSETNLCQACPPPEWSCR